MDLEGEKLKENAEVGLQNIKWNYEIKSNIGHI